MSTEGTSDGLLRIVLVVLAALVLLPVLLMLLTMPMMGMGMMGWWAGGPGTGFSPLWGLGTMLFGLVAVFAVGYVLYRALSGSEVLERDRALEELRVAYARGDLGEEEFDRRRERLRRDRE